jgi:hypothetical protein
MPLESRGEKNFAFPLDNSITPCYTVYTPSDFAHSPLALGEPMSYMTTPLNSIALVSEPTIVNGVAIDGYVGGQPVVFRKGRDGMLIPARGTVLPLSMGTGTVTGYTDDGMLIVNVTDFNDDYEFITSDATNIYDAEEMVDKLNRLYVASIMSQHETFTRIYKSDVTDKLSDTNMDKMLKAWPMPLDTEIIVGFQGDYLKPTDSIVVKQIDRVQRLTSAEKARQRRLEIAQAKRLADALLGENSDIPDEVQAELDEMFGTLD